MSNEVLLDLTFLTEEERDLISNVISKDADIRKQEQNRIGSLRKELDRLKEDGLPEDQLESKNETYCARCQTYFGILLNKGAFCPRCELKVCKVCREKDIDDGWICTLCYKVREVKAQSGAWFFQGHKEKNGNLFGSMLVRQSLRRLPGSYSTPQIDNKSRYASPREEQEQLRHFTAPVNHIKSAERLSGQADKNSNQAQRNGHHGIGYQYSDDSDVDSEQGSHEDTASDKTLSKGESESSESLDSDHEEIVTATDKPLEAQPISMGGNLVQQRLAWGKEGDEGALKNAQDIRSRPTSYNPDAEKTYSKQQDGGNRAQKGFVGETRDDDGALRGAQKARSRPSSSSLDEDMSYVAAPRFTIPSKRRQYSDSEDPTIKPEARGVLAKHRSKSEEYLQNSEEKSQEHKPSADLTVEARTDINDQHIADILEDVFDTRKEDSTPYNIEAGSSLEDKTQDEEYESSRRSRIELSSDDITPKVDFESDSDNSSADYIAPEADSAMDEVTLSIGKHAYNEDVIYKETGTVVESSPDDDSHGYKPNSGQLDTTNDNFTENESKIPIADDFDNDSDSSFENDVRGKEFAADFPVAESADIHENVIGESDDDENTEELSILARVKNWEKKSSEDRFGASATESRSTSETKEQGKPKSSNNRGVKFGVRVMPVGPLGGSGNTEKTFGEAAKIDNDKKSILIKDNEDIVKEEDFDNENKAMMDQYEISPELSGDNEQLVVSVSTEVDEVMEEEQNEDHSPPMVNASMEDHTSIMVDEVESETSALTDPIPSSDAVKTSLNLQQTEQSENHSPMVNASITMDDQSAVTVNEADSVTDPITSSATVKTSLNLEDHGIAFQQESSDNDNISSDNINPDAAMQNDFPPKDITTFDMQPEDPEFETEHLAVSLNTAEENMSEPVQDKPDINREFSSEISSLDFISSNTDSSFKTGANFISSPLQSDTFVDTEVPSMSARYEQAETGTNPFDSEDDTPKSSDKMDVEMSEGNQDTDDPIYDEPYSSQTNVDQPANAPPSPDSRARVLRAFSETFVSMDFGMKTKESSEDQGTDLNVDTKLGDDMGLDTDENLEDRGNFEDRAGLEDRRSTKSSDSQRSSEDRGTREGPDSRRSSELHYEGFHGDNESMISETSGYGTPSASEDTSSKRTPSISGDEGTHFPGEEASLQRRPPSESTPVIVTTEVDDDPAEKGRRNNNRLSITDYEEDLEVSFSKFEGGLGNRKLKDQLSMGSRESIASYYSNAGGEVYGKYPVSGEILFGIKYDPKIQEFQIQIHQGRDLTAVDTKAQTSDPYVKTYLLPDRTRTGKRKSKVKKNTINPVFDEIITYKISYDEILQRTLWLAIWNHDTFGHNDFLGEVLVPIDEYHQSGFSLEDPEPQWYELCERQAGDQELSYNGEIVFALKYVPPSAVVSSKKKKKKKKGEEEKGELHINIIEASNLLAKDANGFSDPFCKSYLLPDKSKKTKQKTAVVKKSLNPKWNYHFVYDNVTHEELMDRVLELSIWDFDRGSSNEFLGGVRLGLGAGLQEWDDATSEEQAAWNKMLNNQNDWNQVSLTLREHMGSYK